MDGALPPFRVAAHWVPSAGRNVGRVGGVAGGPAGFGVSGIGGIAFGGAGGGIGGRLAGGTGGGSDSTERILSSQS